MGVQRLLSGILIHFLPHIPLVYESWNTYEDPEDIGGIVNTLSGTKMEIHKTALRVLAALGFQDKNSYEGPMSIGSVVNTFEY